MIDFVLRRLLMAIPTLWVTLTVIFLLVRVIPGDPTAIIMGSYLSEENVKTLKRQMGLDRPMAVQYVDYLSRFCQFDFGKSLITGTPVLKEIETALPHTLELTGCSLIVGIVTGIPLGLLLAFRRNTIIDYLGRFFSLGGISFPVFYSAILSILFFSIRLDLFPTMGVGKEGDWGSRIQHLVLPSLTLGLLMMSYLTRITRSATLDILNEDYVRTAYAKGLKGRKIIFKHVFKNASIPVITVLGMYTGILIGSSVVTEIIFHRPGLGSLIVGAMLNRDYIVITSVMTLYAAIVILINLITDLSYGLIDPRMRLN
jgi:ABC-type dipeptide/oligopeptide/nickel transport system permease component